MSESPMDLSTGPPYPPDSADKFSRMSENQREKVEDEVRYHEAQLVHPKQMTETSPDNSVFYHPQPSSSNQREKVQDEVRYHQAQLVHPQQMTKTSPDNAVFYHHQPSSSNQQVTYFNNGYNNNGVMNAYTPDGYTYSNPAQSFDPANTDFVYSTTTFDHRQLDPVPNTSSRLSTSMPSKPPPSYSTCHIDLLAMAVSEAYRLTYLNTTDQIHKMMRRPQDDTRFLSYKNMAPDQLWIDCTGRLTGIIEQIIEFAKMIPGFLKLPQEDQILLLKSGCFELSIIRMSRYYDLSTNCVLYGESLLPDETFFTNDNTESNLVYNAFDFAKYIAEKILTDTELALFSAFVLLSPDRPGLKGLAEIQKLRQALLKALRQELEHTHQPYEGEIPVCDGLVASITALRQVSQLHMEAVANLRRNAPNLVLPPLYKELFQ